MKTLSILVALSIQPGFFACLNSPLIETSLNGQTSQGHRLYYHLYGSLELSPADKRPKLSDRASPQDLAVAAILSGDHVKGVAILTELESAKPDDYHTAANLGTAYELMGENEKALSWIQEGIKRNPNSHNGTEWIHVLILKAKLDAENGVPQKNSERLVPLPTEIKEDTLLKINGKEHKAAHVLSALAYQLQERMIFVKPKDRWVSECLYSLAILQSHLYSIEDGLDILRLAESYGFPEPDHLNYQREKLESTLRFNEIRFWTLTSPTSRTRRILAPEIRDFGAGSLVLPFG